MSELNKVQKDYERDVKPIFNVEDHAHVQLDELNPDMYKESYVYDKLTKIFVDVQGVGQHWRGILYLISHAFGFRDSAEKLEEFYDSMIFDNWASFLDVDAVDKYIMENIIIVGADWWTRNQIIKANDSTKEYRAKYWGDK